MSSDISVKMYTWLRCLQHKLFCLFFFHLCRYVTHVSFSPSGLYLVTASNDRLIKVWSLTGKRHRLTSK